MKARRLILLTFLVLPLASLPSHSQDKIYQVKRIVDGDALLLTNEERVRLEFDQANSHTKNRDRYGRILAYVYLRDGTFVNAEIIRQGYGFAYTRFPFRYMKEFRNYEREARENQRGLWRD